MKYGYINMVYEIWLNRDNIQCDLSKNGRKQS